MWINNKTEWNKMLYHQLPLVQNQALWLELPALSPPLENPVWSPLYRSTSSTSPSRALCWHLSRYCHTKTCCEAKTSFFNGVVAINCLACSSRAETMLYPCAGPITCCAAHSAAYRRCSLTLYKGAKCRKYLSEWVSEWEDVFTVFLHSRIFVLYSPTMSKCAKVMSKGVHYIMFSVSPNLESSRNLDTRQIRTAPYYSV